MLNKPLILIVDDDADLGKMLDLILTEGGYRVHVAGGGADALAWLEDQRPDLVLLDIMMPDMDGFTLLRQIRSHQATGQLPVVLITAFADHRTEAESAHAGAHSLLRKPLRAEKLLDHIHRLLEHSG